jgi:hypothetical protein
MNGRLPAYRIRAERRGSERAVAPLQAPVRYAHRFTLEDLASMVIWAAPGPHANYENIRRRLTIEATIQL